MTNHFKYFLCLQAILIYNITAFAQASSTSTIKAKKDTVLVPTTTEVRPTSNPNQIYTLVEKMPAFSGDLNKYLSENLQYPDSEKNETIQGTVYVNFIVEMDGSITNIKILKGIPHGRRLDNEAVRVISAMPKWSAGIQNGQPVRVSYNLLIRFSLN